MSTIFDYIATMEAAPVNNPTGDGFAIFPLFTGTGTGTSGCVGVATLPAMAGDGHADWATFGAGVLPAMTGTGTTDGYHPAWGDASLPALTGDGTAHVLIESVGLLPPLFGTGACGAIASADLPAVTGTGQCGAIAAAMLPAMTGYAIDDSFDRTAAGAGTIPGLTGEAYVCGLDLPIASGATSAAIVNLLQQGNTTLAAAAASICAYDDTDDERAMSVVYFVSNLLTYASDGSGIGDRWTCALATWLRGYGDCEDGSILIHALLLAAGVNPNRVRTAFGTVMTTALVEGGHAWVMYRRLTDEEWIPLEWTFQPSPYTVEASQINRQIDMTDSYTAISYILTNEAFFAVNDVNYIAKLLANRSAGAATLSALTGAGTTGLVASGAASLSALTGTGLCGAIAAASLARMTGTGTAQQLATAWGAATLAAMTGSGSTGAVAAGTLSGLTGTGQCGTSASWRANFPALTGDGTASVVLVGHGLGTLSALTGTGRALVGGVASGVGIIAALTGTGRMEQGPMAYGLATLASLIGTGTAGDLSGAVGFAELSPMIGRGHAINGSASWTGKLSYNPARWA